MSSVTEAIAKAKALSNWINQHVDGLHVAAKNRVLLSVACLHLGLEYHDGIIVLVERGLYGPAFGLLRLVFESYVRGLWLFHCATYSDLERFERDKCKQKFASLILDLEKISAYSDGVLSRTKDDSWRLLNSLTHAGHEQLRRRTTLTSIENDYREHEVVAALQFAGAVAIMSTVGLATVLNDALLAKLAFEQSKVFSS